jgi:nucleoid-associated protein YgaU
MIERISRYYDGPLAQTPNKYSGDYEISVFRSWPGAQSISYIDYTWKEGDSLAALAHAYGLGANFWWEIMDINPEVLNPFHISPGTVLRVPYGN